MYWSQLLRLKCFICFYNELVGNNVLLFYLFVYMKMSITYPKLIKSFLCHIHSFLLRNNNFKTNNLLNYNTLIKLYKVLYFILTIHIFNNRIFTLIISSSSKWRGKTLKKNFLKFSHSLRRLEYSYVWALNSTTEPKTIWYKRQ